MLKIIAAATLVGGLSAMVVIPPSNRSDPPRLALTTDLETRTDTGTRNYLLSQLIGQPVSFCISGGNQCGKQAADAFCRSNGFGEALIFRRDSMQADPANLYFHQIKCWKPKVGVPAD
jgi:hypothetical protein